MENDRKRVFVIDDPACEGGTAEVRNGCETLRTFLLRDGSVGAEIPGDLSGAEVYLLQEQDGREPWRDLAILCTAAEAVRRGGARRITALMPVWPMDWNACRPDDRVSSLPAGIRMLQSAGISRLVTLAAPPVMRSVLMPLQVITPDVSSHIRRILPEEVLLMPAVAAADPSLYENVRRLVDGLQGSLCVYLASKRENLLMLPGCSCVLVAAGNNGGRSIFGLGKAIRCRTDRKVVLLIPQISDRDEEWLAQAGELFDYVITADCTNTGAVEDFVYRLPAWEILGEWITRDH